MDFYRYIDFIGSVKVMGSVRNGFSVKVKVMWNYGQIEGFINTG